MGKKTKMPSKLTKHNKLNDKEDTMKHQNGKVFENGSNGNSVGVEEMTKFKRIYRNKESFMS